MMADTWTEAGWEAEWTSPYLILTRPNGECGLVVLTDTKTRRNETLREFRAAVASHGIVRACQTFWKLRANQDA